MWIEGIFLVNLFSVQFLRFVFRLRIHSKKLLLLSLGQRLPSLVELEKNRVWSLEFDTKIMSDKSCTGTAHEKRGQPSQGGTGGGGGWVGPHLHPRIYFRNPNRPLLSTLFILHNRTPNGHLGANEEERDCAVSVRWVTPVQFYRVQYLLLRTRNPADVFALGTQNWWKLPGSKFPHSLGLGSVRPLPVESPHTQRCAHRIQPMGLRGLNDVGGRFGRLSCSAPPENGGKSPWNCQHKKNHTRQQ